MRFLKNALSVLNRLYKFESGTVSTDRLDLEGQIQLVHDVSREAELAAIQTDPGAAGFFHVGQYNVHAGGDTVQAFVDPYASLDAAWGIPGERWIWLMRYGASATSATAGAGSSARLSLNIPALGNALARRDMLIGIWGSSSATDIKTELTLATMTLISKQAGMDLPLPLFPGGVLGWRTDATAAAPGTIRISTLCWIGPFGVWPPGLR